MNVPSLSFPICLIYGTSLSNATHHSLVFLLSPKIDVAFKIIIKFMINYHKILIQ